MYKGGALKEVRVDESDYDVTSPAREHVGGAMMLPCVGHIRLVIDE